MTTLFSHRGHFEDGIPDNSIASLDKAVEKDFTAIEFDIWLYKDKLVINHDNPEEKKKKSFPNIVDYFKYHNNLEYWLDFKNMDEKNVDEILFLIKRAVQESSIDLNNLYFAPCIDDYATTKKLFDKITSHFGDDVNLVAFCWREETLDSLQNFMTSENIKRVSIYHKLLTQDLVNQYGGNNIFTWTIIDIETIKSLEKLGVENFATDDITPSMLDKDKHVGRNSPTTL